MADRVHQIIRQNLRQIRSKLSPSCQMKASQHVCEKIKRLKVFRYAKKIALYHAINGEISLDILWKSAPYQGKFCYFPALKDNKSLCFLPTTPATDKQDNRFGIPEPNVCHTQAIPVEDLDIIFMPLVAFDKMGNRLGMGAGYYDKTLAGIQGPLLVGVAYQFQQLDHIKTHSLDIPLHAIITDKMIFDPKHRLA
ncbi:5-formyltetrahydrofolate cyclo-ligase [Legionella sp. W05-934-2]|uniref:5-formyltetrahydrofolate cyclo-ligase n=1 Tax=Legionella sp. W05-934-2 TaxID=1198649 RepID=UPI00346340F3